MSKKNNTANPTQLISVLKESLPEWSDIEDKNIKFKRLSGLTNIIYEVKDLSDQRDNLIFKRFSQVEGLLGRQYENEILKQASQKQIGPKCYYADQSYRIQQEICDFNHPTNQQLQDPQLVRKIIQKMSEFHKIELESIKSKPIFSDYILSKQFIARANKGINTKQFTPEEQVVVDRITAYFEDDKLQLLRKILLPKASDKMVKLCHNDVNNLNIMVTDENIYLIDFQYARYNYVAYDIANFLSQSAINYGKETEPFFEFLEDYLPNKKQIDEIAEMYLKYSNEKQTVTAQMIKQLSDDIERCLGLCNFYWAVWSPMTKNPQMDFDYIEHGLKRLERCQNVLNKFLDSQN